MYVYEYEYVYVYVYEYVYLYCNYVILSVYIYIIKTHILYIYIHSVASRMETYGKNVSSAPGEAGEAAPSCAKQQCIKKKNGNLAGSSQESLKWVSSPQI